MEPSYICRLSKYNRWNRLGREIVGYSRVHMELLCLLRNIVILVEKTL